MLQTLTEDEVVHLARMNEKLDHVRDAVRGVVKEFHTGLFLHGEGGTSKSYTVMEEFRRLKSQPILHNSRLTGRGLVDALQASPTDVHVIEDAETMMDDRKAWGVLRSALWSQSTEKPMVRPVSWGAHGTGIRFPFLGGIIVISNANLADGVPEVRAIKSRINVLRIDITAEEIKALMKHICLQGFQYGPHVLEPERCLEVRAFVISELERLQRGLDLRLLRNGFVDYLQWSEGESTLHWHDLLKGRMAERVGYLNRKQQNAAKTRKAVEIREAGGTWKEQVERAEASGLSASSYARALQRG